MALTYTQILRQIEKELGFEPGDISSNTQRKSDFTEDINLALGDAMSVIFKASGTWQYDDSSHTDYPIITTDLVSGQRDYSFTADGSGNLILDIYKVMRKSPTGVMEEIKPVDRNQKGTDLESFETTVSGTPTRYDKLGNGIFLDLIPNYNSEDGLQLFINREGSFFTTSDTTKKAGFAGLYHEYLVLVPAYKYARSNSLKSVARLEKDVQVMEEKIRQYYATRERDIIRKMSPSRENNR